MSEPTISLRDVKKRMWRLRDTEDRSSFYRVVELSPDERDALVEAVEAARADGVRYALGWMRDGRSKRDPVARDVDALNVKLARFSDLEGERDE